MNVADVGRALLRHPVWVAVMVLVAIAAGGVTFTLVSPLHESTASVVVLPPQAGDDVVAQNPLLNLDNTLAQLATVVGSALTSGEVRQQLAGQGATASFTIANTTSDNPSFAQLSPELQFTVTDADAAVAQRTAVALLQAAQDELTALQDRADVPSEARARVVVVAQPAAGTAAGDGQVRAGGGVAIIALVLGTVVVVLADDWLTRRRRRRAQAAADVRPARPRKRIPRPVSPPTPPTASAPPTASTQSTPSVAPAARSLGERDRARAGS